MRFHEEFSTILSVEQSQNDLILRLDTGDWTKPENYKNTVLELKLIDCQNIENSFEEIKRNIGEIIWTYEFSAEKNFFEIWLDNGDKVEIVCDKILEEKCDVNIDELFLKYRWLSESYRWENESNSKGWRKYQRLNNLLKNETERELQNLEKRREFFRKRESANADKAGSAIRICQKILNYIEQVEKES